MPTPRLQRPPPHVPRCRLHMLHVVPRQILPKLPVPAPENGKGVPGAERAAGARAPVVGARLGEALFAFGSSPGKGASGERNWCEELEQGTNGEG